MVGEISFYDARNFAPSKFIENVESNWRRGIGVPFGFKAQRLTRSGMIVDSGAAALSAVTYVARVFMDFSRFPFKRYRTAAQLRLSRAPDLSHATQVIPLKVPHAANIYRLF